MIRDISSCLFFMKRRQVHHFLWFSGHAYQHTGQEWLITKTLNCTYIEFSSYTFAKSHHYHLSDWKYTCTWSWRKTGSLQTVFEGKPSSLLSSRKYISIRSSASYLYKTCKTSKTQNTWFKWTGFWQTVSIKGDDGHNQAWVVWLTITLPKIKEKLNSI